jgi:hypothetical protein
MLESLRCWLFASRSAGNDPMDAPATMPKGEKPGGE